jgi:hypothetical protein
MQYNNISDYEKLLADGVTKVPCGDKTFYVKVAGPLNFNIMEAMADKKISKEERGAKALTACICDSNGFCLFDANNEKHRQIVREFGPVVVGKLMNIIWGFFDKKKES